MRIDTYRFGPPKSGQQTSKISPKRPPRASWNGGVIYKDVQAPFGPVSAQHGPINRSKIDQNPTWPPKGRQDASKDPFGAQLGPFSGPLWGQIQANFTRLGANFGPTSHTGKANHGRDHDSKKACRNHWPKGLFETAPGQTHQRTCPTNCSSRAATVDRSIIIIIISRSTTYSSPDDSFER